MKQYLPIWLIVALVLAGVLSVPCLFKPIFNVDEGVAAASADLLLQGAIPYRDVVDHRGPVTLWFYAIVFLIAGKNNMFAVHVALIVLKIILTLLVAALGTRVLSSRGRVFATFSFVVMANLGFRSDDLNALHTEWILILCTCLASLLLLRGLLQPGRFVSAGLLSGVCFGIAFFTKQPSVLDLLAALAFLVVLSICRPDGFSLKSRSSLILLFVLVCTGFLLVSGSVVGYFVYNDAWNDFKFYFFTYNREYYIAAMPAAKFYTGLLNTFDTLVSPFGFGGLAILGGIMSLLQVCGRYSFESTPKKWLMLYVTLWGVGGLVASMLSARTFDHYFIQLMPSWCLLAGAAYEVLVIYLIDAFAEMSPALRREARLLFFATVTTFCAVHGFSPLARAISSTYKVVTEPSVSGADSRLVEYLQENTTPLDRIFVWGFRPEIYVLSGRNPASRFTYCTFIVGLVPLANTGERVNKEDIEKWAVPGSCDRLVEDLRKDRPRFIIDSSLDNNWGFARFSIEKYPKIAAVLRADYEIDRQFEAEADGAKWKYRLYRRKKEGSEAVLAR